MSESRTRTLRDPADIFDAARALPDEPRRLFLDSVCGDDPALRARVEGLLRSAQAAEAFFEESSTAVTAALAALHASGGSAGMIESLGEYLPGQAPIGSRIGRYKLLRKIGEGGCGVVYEAEQEEPVRRRVALKIIRVGMETRSVIARFEAERQALALMDHPNIAHVYDAGATRHGPPYFVMELVRGVKITDYCDHHRLDTRQRLDLFVQTCHAIQHAHQKGVIHGDIKPSNIMVTLQDGVPVPKVIDFGVAKAAETSLLDRMFVTGDGQLVGTPAYMSPEQADRGSTDVDTRSDIYSLGVLLYELLTGTTPLDMQELGGAGFDTMCRKLREEEPPRPSQRLKRLAPEVLAQRAAARRIHPAQLGAECRGDLDWIVMKALEKDRRRRYETANGLGVDIQRYLGNEPVTARPPTRVYRLRKLVRRNRGVFIAAAAVLVTLVFGLATSTWLYFREREARQRAVQAEQQETRLRLDAEARQRVTEASYLISQDRYADADALVPTLSTSEPSVEAAVVLRALGEWHAVEGRWSLAAARLRLLLTVDQIDGWDTATLDLLRYGPAVLESGDLAAYEQFRVEALARYLPQVPPSADRVLKICLLRPAGKEMTESMRPFAEMTAAALLSAEAEGDGFTTTWRAMALALWELRTGNPAAAVHWASRCTGQEDNNPPRTAAACLIQGMAERQLGHHAAAAQLLQRAEQLLEENRRGPQTRGGPVFGFWFDWQFAHLLAREARGE